MCVPVRRRGGPRSHSDRALFGLMAPETGRLTLGEQLVHEADIVGSCILSASSFEAGPGIKFGPGDHVEAAWALAAGVTLAISRQRVHMPGVLSLKTTPSLKGEECRFGTMVHVVGRLGG